MAGPGIILLAAAVATGPEWWQGASCGHDFDFHLVSWFDALHAWRHGLLYPHWTPSANYGAGEPRFVFYPPLTWMLGAALGTIFPWQVVPAVLTFLMFAGCGLATRALARKALRDGAATLAGCAAIFSGYSLFTAYERTAFGEMAGGFWVPLLLLLLLRDAGPPETEAAQAGAHRPASVFDRTTLSLILVLAGAWLSNAPLGVMAGYLLAAVGLATALLNRSWRPALRAMIAGALGTGLAAFYLVPAAWEQHWVDIQEAVNDPGYRIENSWMFARHSDPRLELHDVELTRISVIGAAMIAIALVGLLVSWWRGTLPRNRRWWIPIGLIPLGVLFLQLPVSLPVWNLLPKLRFLQFPWRWLVVLEAPMGLLLAAAVWGVRRWMRILTTGICGVVCLGALAFTWISFFQTCDNEDAVAPMMAAYKAGSGFAGSDEYAPPGADNRQVATNLPAACLVSDPQTALGQGELDTTPDWAADQGSCRATYSWAAETAERRELKAAVPDAGFMVLRLREYPAWNVTVNGKEVTDRGHREDGLMVLPAAAGQDEIRIRWTTTPDVIAGRLLSLVSLALIAGVGLLVRRRAASRLS